MILAKAWNKWRAAFRREPPKADPAPQPASSRPLKGDGPFSPPGPEPDQTPAPGASALLDAWKARESALIHPPDPPKPESSPFPQSPGPPQPSASDSRPVASDPEQLAAFAPWFVAIAAATGLGGWLLLSTAPSDPQPNTAQSEPAQPAPMQFVMCPLEPVVPVAGDKDGRFPMQADVSGLTAVDGASFVILSNEASAAGRARDAEVALLMSCRIADKLKGAASVESADAKYRLGLHYAALSLRDGSAAAPNRAELLERAQTLLADSLLTYSTRFGDNDDRSRLAANGLASVRQNLAQQAQPQSTSPLSPGSPGEIDPAGATKLPTPSLPAIVAMPPATKQCPPAIATLGLCDSP